VTPTAWLIGVASILGTGALVQRTAEWRDRRTHPAPGRLVDAGDARVHVVIEGSGPVVLIDSGLGGSSIEWAEVAANLGRYFTVVRYDRPGFGWSPGSRCDRRALAAATRMVTLLESLALQGPALLVGHSLGGVHVRLAAALAPTQVSGLVLVDPSHEGMLSVLESSRAARMTTLVMRFLAWSAPVGLGRIAGRGLSRLALAELRQPPRPDQVEGARLTGLLTTRTIHGIRAMYAEQAALEDSLRQLVELAGREPEVPLTVITASAPSDEARVVAARAQLDPMHVALAARPWGRQVLAGRSGHLVPLDQPEIITRCVRETAAAITRGAWEKELTS
jgi:pimeloyl-ACP methyl ester carboxylesterase